jgi:hypothetical protein
MSASDVVITVPTVSTVSKKPKLAAKYEKVMVVAYSLIQAFSANGILPQDNLAAAYDEILLFAPVEDQILFYELFLDNAKDNAKAMRKVITLHNKPPKAPKEPKATKPKATKEPKTGDDHYAEYLASSNAPVEEKKKRVYKKKTAEPAPVDTVEPVAEPTPVEAQPKKSRAKKTVEPVAEPAPVDTVEPVAEPTPVDTVEPVAEPTPVEAQPKKSRAKKTVEPVAEPAPVPVHRAERAPTPPLPLEADVPTPVKAAEPAPVETAEPAPVETKSKKSRAKKTVEPVAEPTPTETKPTETKPTETKPTETKSKKSRGKKNVSVSNDVQDDLIGQIISAANSTPTPTPVQAEEDEDEVIQTREFTFKGKLFLIDDYDNLYDTNTFELVGVFDHATQSIL